MRDLLIPPMAIIAAIYIVVAVIAFVVLLTIFAFEYEGYEKEDLTEVIDTIFFVSLTWPHTTWHLITRGHTRDNF